MGFTMAPAFFSTDLDRTSKFWVALFALVRRDASYMILDWIDRISGDGFIHAPVTTFYGMIEWGMTDPDANGLRVGGPAEPH